MKEKMISTISWLIVLWTSKVFLLSLPYKFTLHPDTQHIFGTIGQWLNGILGDAVGTWFSHYGSYVVGTFELITALVLLSPVLFWMLTKIKIIANAPSQSMMHAVGGLMASGVMAGAVFFHLFTPLGIEVIHEGQSDHGSLFYAAVSILVFGFLLFVMNFMQLQSVKLKEE